MAFSFVPGTTISTIEIGFNTGPSLDLPLSVTINGETFNLVGNELANDTMGLLSFPLTTPFVGSDLTVSLTHDPTETRAEAAGTAGEFAPWIFVDEVQFVGSSGAAAPEPGALALMALGLGSASLVVRRRAKTAVL